MRAVDIKNEVGDADALFINDNVPTPVPRRESFWLESRDLGLWVKPDGHHTENGEISTTPQAPKTLGVEFSGIVESLGAGVDCFKKGDPVFGLTYGGAYAEFVAVSSGMCIHKPEGLSYEVAASIPETWITATQALWTVGGFKPGDKVLIHAGTSGVGIAAIQLAVHAGAGAVYTTASSQEKLDFCTGTLGATAGFNYKTQDFAEEVLKVTKDLTSAAKDGRIVLLAMMSGPLAKEVNLVPILFKRLRIEGTTLRSHGTLKVFVEKVFDWKDIVDAHKLMESNQTQGKIICTID
ncbi:hypothetical protein BDD12DRAFT_876278 [Trichophaea hybrida]|nr:hypothetical protein BDD12DRAFT_879570 [Trichophaea hybrida]KAF8542485.1 hypothetical protein BDD12DRAFT_876278 [Trichophaea hybrida]